MTLGGEVYYVNRNELTFPLGLPDDLGIGGLIFADIGTVYNTSSSGSNIRDESSCASAGIGLSWLSPFGPGKFYLSKAILKKIMIKKRFLGLVWYNILNKLYKGFMRNIFTFIFTFFS